MLKARGAVISGFGEEMIAGASRGSIKGNC